ncbi:hypothetical protein, partial [Streptomyces sp. NPDC044948]|uniref:hypothetical protein n=1 Tax=Streptomyces sp. NPDC044948 TaxID=3157092 RepID=UPI0033FC838F
APPGPPLRGVQGPPRLVAPHSDARFKAVPELPEPRWSNAADHSSFFATVQARLADVLFALWPSDADPEPVHEAGLGGFGWLPQRYHDGWFLRRGDVRSLLSDGQMRTWRQAAARRSRT